MSIVQSSPNCSFLLSVLDVAPFGTDIGHEWALKGIFLLHCTYNLIALTPILSTSKETEKNRTTNFV